MKQFISLFIKFRSLFLFAKTQIVKNNQNKILKKAIKSPIFASQSQTKKQILAYDFILLT